MIGEIPVGIPQSTVDEMMAKCARCCCICRRFSPVHLQVHHIVEQSDGGSNDPDNLIVVCLTCHSDVHTQTKLTRRFTPEELKQHRKKTHRLVEHGRLPAGAPAPNAVEQAMEGILDRINSIQPNEMRTTENQQIPPMAVRILIETSRDRGGRLSVMRVRGGFLVNTNGVAICEGDNPRLEAEAINAIQILEQQELLAPRGNRGEQWLVTHEGYHLADALLAIGGDSSLPNICTE